MAPGLHSFDTTGVYGDDAFSEGGDSDDEEDEWDLDKYRAETLAEQERLERERIEKLGGRVEGLNLAQTGATQDADGSADV